MLYFSEANAKTKNLMGVPALAEFLTGGRKVYSLDLSSGVSCPGAEHCHSWVVVKDGKAKIQDGPNCVFRCFSASQEVLFPAVRFHRTDNLQQIKNAKYAGRIAKLVLDSLPANVGIIRLHVAGDFFSYAYMQAIFAVACARTDILFYFYTKSLHFLQRAIVDVPGADLSKGIIFNNLRVTGSRGGKYDYLLDILMLREAAVVFSVDEADDLGFPVDHSDEHAALPGGDFALLVHGTQPAGSESGKAVSKLRKQGGLGQYGRNK